MAPRMRRTRLLALMLALSSAVVPSVAVAQSGATDWQGRQLRLLIGYGPGGGYDDYARLIGRYFGRYLPGNPTIVVSNEPGAGSIRLANELYNVLPGDGSVIGMIGDVLLTKQVIGEPGINFAAQRFGWIGRLGSTDPVLVVRPQSGIANIRDAKTREVPIGIPGAGSATGQTILILNNLLGTRFKLVSGYRSGTEVRLAVERGEVEGSGSVLWSLHRDWVRQNNLTPIYQIGFERIAELADTPRLVDLADTDDQRRLLRFFASYVEIGRSVLAPPSTPPQILAQLRNAFARMAADPQLISEARQQNISLSILSGEQLQKAAEELSNLPEDLRAAAVAIARATGGN